MSLSNTSQFYFDITTPLPPQRFYRAWQSGTPSVVPSLQLPYFVPAITLTGSIGDSVRLDYINAIGPDRRLGDAGHDDADQHVAALLRMSAPWSPGRLYRIVPVP